MGENDTSEFSVTSFKVKQDQAGNVCLEHVHTNQREARWALQNILGAKRFRSRTFLHSPLHRTSTEGYVNFGRVFSIPTSSFATRRTTANDCDVHGHLENFVVGENFSRITETSLSFFWQKACLSSFKMLSGKVTNYLRSFLEK